MVGMLSIYTDCSGVVMDGVGRSIYRGRVYSVGSTDWRQELTVAMQGQNEVQASGY